MTDAQTTAAATLATLTRRLVDLREARRLGTATTADVRAAEVAVCYAELEVLDMEHIAENHQTGN